MLPVQNVYRALPVLPVEKDVLYVEISMHEALRSPGEARHDRGVHRRDLTCSFLKRATFLQLAPRPVPRHRPSCCAATPRSLSGDASFIVQLENFSWSSQYLAWKEASPPSTNVRSSGPNPSRQCPGWQSDRSSRRKMNRFLSTDRSAW